MCEKHQGVRIRNCSNAVVQDASGVAQPCAARPSAPQARPWSMWGAQGMQARLRVLVPLMTSRAPVGKRLPCRRLGVSIRESRPRHQHCHLLRMGGSSRVKKENGPQQCPNAVLAPVRIHALRPALRSAHHVPGTVLDRGRAKARRSVYPLSSNAEGERTRLQAERILPSISFMPRQETSTIIIITSILEKTDTQIGRAARLRFPRRGSSPIPVTLNLERLPLRTPQNCPGVSRRECLRCVGQDDSTAYTSLSFPTVISHRSTHLSPSPNDLADHVNLAFLHIPTLVSAASAHRCVLNRRVWAGAAMQGSRGGRLARCGSALADSLGKCRTDVVLTQK